MVVGYEKQPVKIRQLHTPVVVSYARQRRRPDRTEANQVRFCSLQASINFVLEFQRMLVLLERLWNGRVSTMLATDLIRVVILGVEWQHEIVRYSLSCNLLIPTEFQIRLFS